MTAIQIAVTGAFVVTGAYAGLLVGQLAAYYVTKALFWWTTRDPGTTTLGADESPSNSLQLSGNDHA